MAGASYGNPATITVPVSQYVEVRLVFGAERDYDFDWTRVNGLVVSDHLREAPKGARPLPDMKAPMPRRIVRIIIDIALILAVVAAGFIAYGLIGNRWYHIVSIASGSMEPALATGSLAIITPPPEQMQPGMVITFVADGRLVTHRVIEVRPDGFPVTQGDANNTPDQFDSVTVVGQVQFTIPLLGFVLPQAAPSGAIFTSTVAGTQQLRVADAWAKATPTVPDQCRGMTFDRVLTGTPGDDVYAAGNGGVLILGLGGNDTLSGGNGNDCLVGGDGDDILVGNGKDVLLGGDGDDTLHGGGDGDAIDGGNGMDLLDGGEGTDSCHGTSKDVYISCETAGTSAPRATPTPTPTPELISSPDAQQPSGKPAVEPTPEPAGATPTTSPDVMPDPTPEPTPEPTVSPSPTPALAPVIPPQESGPPEPPAA